MRGLQLISSKFYLFLIATFLLSGCSTIDGFLGGGMNDPANMETAEAEMTEPMPIEEMGPTPEELLAEKDQALVDQGMRLADAQNQLNYMQEENSALRDELDAAKQDALEKQEMLEQQAAEQVVAAAEGAVVASNGPRISAPDGGYGLHVASYILRESIEPGIRNIGRSIPVLINGRPIKIANANVRGRDYLRLIIGQFDRQSDAAAECQQALLLIEFCEVVAFEGEDY